MGLGQKDVSVQVNHYRFYRLSYQSGAFVITEQFFLPVHYIVTSRQVSVNTTLTLSRRIFILRGHASFVQ